VPWRGFGALGFGTRAKGSDRNGRSGHPTRPNSRAL